MQQEINSRKSCETLMKQSWVAISRLSFWSFLPATKHVILRFLRAPQFARKWGERTLFCAEISWFVIAEEAMKNSILSSYHFISPTIHGSELDASFPQLNYKFNREKRNQLSSSLIYLLSIADPIIDKTAVGGSLNVRPTSSRLCGQIVDAR